MNINEKLRYLLLQIRNSEDPMRQQEVGCFARRLGCSEHRISVHCLLAESNSEPKLDSVDMVLVGGSGDYSAASEGDWLERSLDVFRKLYEQAKPTFASCWGFQAMSRALGGSVAHDAQNAELGTHEVRLTQAGLNDPLFATLGDPFLAHMGHEDRVTELPPNAILLASTDRVENQAYYFPDRPIYATQFHPELDRTSLLQRVEAYPDYIQYATGMTYEGFAADCHETPAANGLIPRFVEHFFGK